MSSIFIILLLIASLPVSSIFPISQPFGYLNHVGIDFKVPVGTEVYADVAGTITKEQDNARVYGRYLTIKHKDGYISLYAHLSKFKVNEGDFVVPGQVIALSGGDPDDKIDGDGWSNGAHLHWEIRVPGHIDNNLYNIDPMEYLKFFVLMVKL